MQNKVVHNIEDKNITHIPYLTDLTTSNTNQMKKNPQILMLFFENKHISY
jgi:hypothetical protein